MYTKMKNDEKIKQIGYMPTTLEDEKINLITKIFDLTRVNVLRNLIHSHLSIEDLYERALELQAERGDDDAVNITEYIVKGRALL